jgi:hypothetical protein
VSDKLIFKSFVFFLFSVPKSNQKKNTRGKVAAAVAVNFFFDFENKVI